VINSSIAPTISFAAGGEEFCSTFRSKLQEWFNPFAEKIRLELHFYLWGSPELTVNVKYW